MHQRRYYVYVLTNPAATVFYVGLTNDLHRRVEVHKEEIVEGFSKRYNVHRLVYYEEYTDVHAAIAREKQLNVHMPFPTCRPGSGADRRQGNQKGRFYPQNVHTRHPEQREEPALSLPKGPLLIVEQDLEQRFFAALRMTK